MLVPLTSFMGVMYPVFVPTTAAVWNIRKEACKIQTSIHQCMSTKREF